MLRFKQFITTYLTEAKIDDYKSQETEIPTDHDPNGIHKTASDIIDHFHSHNPTGDVNHTRWMVNQYKQGNIKQEDAPAMKDLLSSFNSNKDKLKKKRLEQYKTHGELNTALQSVAPSKTQLQSQKELDAIQKGSTLIHNSPDSSWYHVHDKHASRVLGKGMPWCTSRMDEQNMFDHYNSMSNGRFYIGHMHNEQFPYRKIGVGVGTGEFQDENNDKIEGDRLKEFIARNPHLKDIKELQGSNIEITKDIDEHFDDLLENDQDGLMYHMDTNPERFNERHEKRVDFYNEQRNKAWNGDASVKNSPFKSVVESLAQNTNNSDLLHELSDHQYPSVRSAVARNRFVLPETSLKLTKDSNPFVRGSIRIRKIPKEYRGDIFKNEDNPAVIHSHAKQLYNDGDHPENYSDILYNNKNTPDSVLKEIFHKHSIEKMLAHPQLGPETLTSLYWNNKRSNDDKNITDIIRNHDESDDNLLSTIIRNNDLQPHEAKQILEHRNTGPLTLSTLIQHHPELHEDVAKHGNADEDTLYNLVLNSDNPEVHKSIIEHPNVTPEILSSLSGYTTNPETHKKILSNKKTDDEVLHKVIKKSYDPEVHRIAAGHNKNKWYTLETLSKISDDPEVHKSILNNPKSDNITGKIIAGKYGFSGIDPYSRKEFRGKYGEYNNDDHRNKLNSLIDAEIERQRPFKQQKAKETEQYAKRLERAKNKPTTQKPESDNPYIIPRLSSRQRKQGMYETIKNILGK